MVREKVSLLKYTQPFHPQLIESADAEPEDTQGWVYWDTLYKGLEHPRILVSTGVLETIPQIPRKDCIYFLAFTVTLFPNSLKGMTYFFLLYDEEGSTCPVWSPDC